MAGLPHDFLLAGIPLCQPITGELLAVKNGADCGCALGTMLVGLAQSFSDAVSKLLPVASEKGLYDIVGLATAAGIKGAALNNVQAIAPAWQKQNPCPVDKTPHWAGSMMAHLTDGHGWTREQVAAWLVTVGL